MGATNFLRAKVLETSADRLRVMVSGVVFEMKPDNRLKVGDETEIVVRPEWINLNERAVENAASIQGEIVQAIFYGATCNFVVKTGENESFVVRRSNGVGEASIPAGLSVGAKVWASWSPDAMHPIIQ
jgi:ABC-type Fe3+/spermidine/putrescine transport system ATPase subunit